MRLLEPPGPRIAAAPILTPFLKWPGGKSQELAAISASAPELTGRFIDPFVGGGSVLLATPAEVPAWANDATEDLVRLYVAAASRRSALHEAALGLARAWDDLGGLDPLYADLADAFLTRSHHRAQDIVDHNIRGLRAFIDTAGSGLSEQFGLRLVSDLPRKFERMRKIETAIGSQLSRVDLLENVEGAIRSALYMSVRARYNRTRLAARWDEFRLADFFFLREFAYAAMFRFNRRGEFNVPYGGISYNRKSFADKVALLSGPEMLARLANTQWRCGDFEPFLCEAAPGSDDFVFIDPPYDSDFSDYDDVPFGPRDQQRLQQALDSLPARVMIVIKDTPMIRDLYRSDRWRVAEAGKTYMWTIKSRNDRAVTHLTITNY
ncbi:MAG TPA: DNA adenine methylase [Candidatus Saccharimonadales bacterium]|nr:DNA adenine methylase [Candidatus Saccharimonadales bacterium]